MPAGAMLADDWRSPDETDVALIGSRHRFGIAAVVGIAEQIDVEV